MGEIEVYDEVFEFWVPGVGLTGERENMVGYAKGVPHSSLSNGSLTLLTKRGGAGYPPTRLFPIFFLIKMLVLKVTTVS